MPIEFTCTCGKKLRVREELAGKKVRCPICQAAVPVPEAEREPPRDQPMLAIPIPEEESQESPPAREEREKPQKSRPAGPEGPAKKKSSLVPALVGCLGVALLGCLGVCGGGAYFLRGGGVDERLVGSWVPENARNGGAALAAAQTRWDFRPDGSCTTASGNKERAGRWKKLVATRAEAAILIDWTSEPGSQLLDVTFLDDGHVQVRTAEGEQRLKKGP